jgi:hypothetical protein
VLLTNLHTIHIHIIRKPPLPLPNLNIIPTHLPLPHPPILRKRPVFKSISSPPLARGVVPFVPELYRDLFIISQDFERGETRGSAPMKEEGEQTLLSVKANSSFLNRYPFSTSHFLVKKSTISLVPRRNWERFRQMESGV